MIHLNLTTAQRQEFESQLTASSHRMRVTIHILDTQEKVLRTLQNAYIVSGAVQVDATQSVSRSLQIVLMDPGHRLVFDATNPGNQALFADNFIAVEYGVEVSFGDGWVDVPVFWGPLTAFERVGSQVTLEAQGKESLAQDPYLVVTGYHIPSGTSVANAIKNVMTRQGETKYALSNLPGKLHKHRTILAQDAPWDVVTGGITAAANPGAVNVGGITDANGHPIPGLISKAGGHRVVFYDGRGVLTAKNHSGGVLWTFDQDYIVSQPGFSYDITTFRNHVEVTGGTPKKSKHHFRGHATLSASNPLSPAAMARHGHPRYLTTFFQSDALKSDAECNAKAQSILDGIKNMGVTATFDTLPVPHLEEYDHIRLNWDGYSVNMPLVTWTLPLTADTPMSVGFTRPATRVKTHHKRHKR